MLDNYTAAALIEDAQRLKAAFPRTMVEASGVRMICRVLVSAANLPLPISCFLLLGNFKGDVVFILQPGSRCCEHG